MKRFLIAFIPFYSIKYLMKHSEDYKPTELLVYGLLGGVYHGLMVIYLIGLLIYLL